MAQDIPRFAGLTMDDKNLILLDKEQGIEEMKETIIHEFIHTKHFRKGDIGKGRNTIEKYVQAETVMTYLELYGVRP